MERLNHKSRVEGRYLFTNIAFLICYSNTVFPRIIAGSDYFFFRTKRGRLFEGRRLFEIFLTEGRALNILFYYTIKSKK